MVDVALTDLRREFDLASSQPRHLVPQPKTTIASLPAAHATSIAADLLVPAPLTDEPANGALLAMNPFVPSSSARSKGPDSVSLP